jgi:hypothetical protein
MRKIATFIAATGVAVAVSASPVMAGVINGVDVSDGQSSFSPTIGAVTLSASRGGSTSTLGSGGGVLGVTGGKGANKVDDTDGVPGGSDQEVLHMSFDSTYGLANISFKWTRADGGGAIRISGFSSNPGAAVTKDPGANDISASYDNDDNELSIVHPWQGPNVSIVSLSNLSASKGQTLDLSVDQTDLEPNQGGPQAAVLGIDYAVPEPASLAMLGFGGTLVLGRRRNA